MKQQQKMTVTISMLWIGAMVLLSNTAWIRAARDFVVNVTGGTSTPAQVNGPAGRQGGQK